RGRQFPARVKCALLAWSGLQGRGREEHRMSKAVETAHHAYDGDTTMTRSWSSSRTSWTRARINVVDLA
ncbi:hypothetical protein, partial [Streptosporangium vulgare]|uniref:hypothetical protein n=1 Tax=Streptosporangium vulgare TaxID=46190 RepID=UPI0031D467C5